MASLPSRLCGRKRIYSGITGVVCTVLMIVPAGRLITAQGQRQSLPLGVARFLKVDRQRLIAARLEGKKTVMLLVASRPGENTNVAQQVTALGANVRFREDSVDYLRFLAPTARVDEILRLRGIEVVAIDGVQMYDTLQDSSEVARKKTPPPDVNTPAENPFLPTRDIGAPQFIRDHPTFDGRGVTIGNLDGNTPDLLAPELQRATTLDGRSVPKIIDVVNSLDPMDDTDSSLRIDMSNEVQAQLERFDFKGMTYRVQSDGPYRLGFFEVARFGSGLLRKYLPETATATRDQLAVLWDEKTSAVWVDTNQNQSFVDETKLTDFNVSYQAGILGQDNPATPLRETVAFTILIDSAHKLVYLAPLANGHATNTASVAAGNGFFGGGMNGVAPGAQIASLLQKSVTHSMVEGMILTIKNPKVDLVSMQWAAMIPPQDGKSVLGIIFDRLVEKYKKPIFVGADNRGPGINTTTESATADRVISVGGYINKQTWQSNYGVTSSADDALVNLSSRGPRADGGFKPDVVAPAAAVSAVFGASSQPNAPFVLPPGYSSGSGTSLACPMVSGAAALLISAAKQTGVAYDAERIRWALRSSARYLPEIGAHEQGSGLINVSAAWEALKRAPAPVKISSSTRINVSAGPYLATPHHGPGIYDREGWQPGLSGQRSITFTRTSGSAQPIDYVLRWTGNDGTFSSPTKIRLPLNTPVALPVTIAVKTPGAHSAILNLDQPDGAQSIYQVMNTVVAADQFTPQNNFTVSRGAAISYPGYESFFFNVPPNTGAFRIDAKIDQGTLRLRFMRPSGKALDEPRDIPPRWQPQYQTGGNLDRVIVNPETGVWQVIIENQSPSAPGELTTDAQRARLTLTASVFGTEAQTPLTRLSAARPEYKQVRMMNNYAPFAGAYTESSLGSAYSNRFSIAPGDEATVYDINVPPGAGLLSARTSSSTSRQADVDLYLYLCANNQCELKAYSTRNGVDESVTIARPQAGKWKLVIDPVSPPATGLTLDYTDIFTHPAFGSLVPLSSQVNFGTNTISDANLSFQISAAPTGNRRLVGVLQLLSRDSYTVYYEYNPTTKKIEPIKERVSFGEATIELRSRVVANL